MDRWDLSQVPFIDREDIPPVQLLPDSTRDDSEGLSISPLFADDLSSVFRMDLDGEARATLCRVRLDDDELGQVNHRADHLGEQLRD